MYVETTEATCLSAEDAESDSKLWHKRLGHLNYRSLGHLCSKKLVHGISKIVKPGVVPQNLPSHILQEIAKPSCKIPQGLHSAKISHTVKIRVLSLVKKMKFLKVQSSLTCLQIGSSILISSFKAFSTKLHSQNPKLHYSQL